MNGRYNSQALRDLPEPVATLGTVAGFGSVGTSGSLVHFADSIPASSRPRRPSRAVLSANSNSYESLRAFAGFLATAARGLGDRRKGLNHFLTRPNVERLARRAFAGGLLHDLPVASRFCCLVPALIPCASASRCALLAGVPTRLYPGVVALVPGSCTTSRRRCALLSVFSAWFLH
jgi:hypothetical protein